MKTLILVILFSTFTSVPSFAGEHEESESASVGPEKGILAADDHVGFKLSPEAMKNFDLQFLKIGNPTQMTVPESALVLSGEEVNLYRLREGFFKRIDFKTIRKMGNQIVISSPDLKATDEIVTVGTGFLRIAELAAFGGAATSHSH